MGLKRMDSGKAISVNSIIDEYSYINRKGCVCGGSFEVKGQTLLSQNRRFYDELTLLCRNCGKNEVIIFDVTSFFLKDRTAETNLVRKITGVDLRPILDIYSKEKAWFPRLVKKLRKVIKKVF